MRSSSVAAALLLIAAAAAGQQTPVRLSGRVVESGQFTPIRGATIELPGVGRLTTDDAGAFHFNRVPAGFHRIRVQALGYETLESSIMVRGDTTMQLQLQPVPLEVEFAAARDTALLFDLEIDPVAQRMLQEAVARIEARGRGQRAVGMPAVSREELLRSAYRTVYDLLHRHGRLQRVR